MSWSEVALFVLVSLSVPFGLVVYAMGEERGARDCRRTQRYMLSGRTWLWVDGRFYPVDATEDQMEQVMAFEMARKSVTKETIMRDANVEVGE